MGNWGYGIRQDDFVCDVIDAFEDLLKAGKSVAEATTEVSSKFSSEIKDPDDGPLFWIALADVQWTFGQLQSQVLQQVKQDYDSGRSITQWTEDQRGLARRKAELEKFILKIGTANPRPKKLPKIVVRAPKFRRGDCLSIRLADGRYAAALVLVADHSIIEYGKNLIGVLDYLSADKPTLETFRERKWLILTHHDWDNEMYLAWYHYTGFRAAKNRLEVVGQIEILESDPHGSGMYCGWAGIGEQVVRQRAWDANAT